MPIPKQYIATHQSISEYPLLSSFSDLIQPYPLLFCIPILFIIFLGRFIKNGSKFDSTSGLSDSCKNNPIRLIRTPTDTEMAMQMGKVAYRNVIGEVKDGNQFFSNGAIACIAGFSLVSKLTPYPDFLTVRELSNLEQEDFKKMLQSPLIPESTKMVFDILRQASDDTCRDLKATVSSVVNQLLVPDFVEGNYLKPEVENAFQVRRDAIQVFLKASNEL